MPLLVVSTICCLIAVMWVALALARRIRLARAFEARTITPLVAKLAQQRLSRLVNLESSASFASNRRFCSISPADLYWRSYVDLYHGAVVFLEAPEGVEHWATTSAARRSELIAIGAAAAYPALFGQSLPIASIVPRHSRDGHKFVKPAAGLQTRTLHRDAIQSNHTSSWTPQPALSPASPACKPFALQRGDGCAALTPCKLITGLGHLGQRTPNQYGAKIKL